MLIGHHTKKKSCQSSKQELKILNYKPEYSPIAYKNRITLKGRNGDHATLTSTMDTAVGQGKSSIRSCHLLVAKSVVGVNAGCTFLIPRITLSPSANIFLFTLRHQQFLVRPSFAMISLRGSRCIVMVFCTRDFFGHGQFYVVASRVCRSSRLCILT